MHVICIYEQGRKHAHNFQFSALGIIWEHPTPNTKPQTDPKSGLVLSRNEKVTSRGVSICLEDIEHDDDDRKRREGVASP